MENQNGMLEVEGGKEERITYAQELVSTNEEFAFYFPRKKATRVARIILVITYLFTIIACCIGMGAMMSGTDLGAALTTISLIMFGVAMIYYIQSIIRMNQAMQYVMVTDNYRCFQVQAHKLNQIRGYDFSNQSAIVAMNLDRLSESEMGLLKTSIMTAIQKIDSGLLLKKDPVCKAVKELRNGTVVKDGTHKVKISYVTRDGKTKTETLPKIYPNLTIFYTVNMDGGVYYANYWTTGIIGAISIALAFTGIAGFVINIMKSADRMEEQREEAEFMNSYDADQIIDNLEALEEDQEKIQELLAQLEAGENSGDEGIEEVIELTDENYQMFNEPIDGFDYVTVHYYKYFDGGYVDAYVPNGEVTYVDDGYGIESTLYGMKTYTTMKDGYNTAQEVVEEQLAEAISSSSIQIYDPEMIEVYYESDWDIAITSYVCNEGGTDKVVYLYADTRGNGVYMYSEITYLFDELVEEADLLIKELSNVYAFDLPTVFE